MYGLSSWIMVNEGLDTDIQNSIHKKEVSFETMKSIFLSQNHHLPSPSCSSLAKPSDLVGEIEGPTRNDATVTVNAHKKQLRVLEVFVKNSVKKIQ